PPVPRGRARRGRRGRTSPSYHTERRRPAGGNPPRPGSRRPAGRRRRHRADDPGAGRGRPASGGPDEPRTSTGLLHARRSTPMKKERLINVAQPEECRIAIVEDGVLEELYVERTSQESYVGNIYKGRIVNIEPSIQAAFVDFGIGRNGFLHVSD